jgi:serine/threonine protein kinase
MAPEVGTEEPYNELCDVYSFGVLIWQMMSLSKPYDNISLADLQCDVWKQDPSARRPSPSLVDKGECFLNKRRFGCGFQSLLLATLKRRRCQESSLSSPPSTSPPIPCRGSPASLQALVESCWSYRLVDRPSMQQVERRLKDEILAFETIHGDCKGGECDRRLSHTRRRSTFVLENEEEEIQQQQK